MGNLAELANIFLPKNTYIVRQERIKREGSKYYTWDNNNGLGAIASGASVAAYIPDLFPESRKYQPLDWLEIINNEAVNNISVKINNRDSFLVPANIIRTIKRCALWHINITNNGGAVTTAGNIILTMRKEPKTIDKWASEH